MYKLLLVDDETATRKGILNNINWQEIGIKEVRDAKNGVLALEIAKNFVPDILLTDIKMPKMNGIDLSHRVREINPDCSILIMSGYSEIDYLKSAIRLSALNFVDKPIDIKRLTEWIKKSVEVQNRIRKNKEYIENNRWFLINDTALGLIRNKEDSKKYIQQLKELYPDLSPDCKSLCIMLKLFDQDFSGNLKNIDLSDISTRIGKLLDNNSCHYVLGAADSSTVVIILFMPEDFSNEPAFNALSEDLISICKPFELFISAGIAVNGPELAYESYITALKLLEQIFFSKNKRIIRYDNRAKSLSHEYMSKQIEVFTSYIKNGDLEKAVKLIENTTFHISMHPNTETSIVIDFYFKLILEVLRQKNYSETKAISCPDYDNVLSRINSCNFLDEIKEYTQSIVNQYFNDIYASNALSPIDQVLSIIHNSYNNKELSLNEISQKTFLSVPYICVRFKEVTGKTFSRYLTEYRIEKSLELLKDKNNKINYIAEKVGFANGNYFSKTFRKIKGISPAEYRQRFCVDRKKHDII